MPCPADLRPPRGFTLAELLVVVSVLAIVAGFAAPLLVSQHTRSLDVAAAEVGLALRHGIAEASRAGGYVLIDAKTAPGKVQAFFADSAGNPGAALIDPGSRRALVLDTASTAHLTNVKLTPQFMQGGTAWLQLLIGPGNQLQAFDGPLNNRGALQAGSGVVVTVGARSSTVALHELTGLVSLP